MAPVSRGSELALVSTGGIAAVHRARESQRVGADRAGNADISDGPCRSSRIRIVRASGVDVAVEKSSDARRVIVSELAANGKRREKNEEDEGQDALGDCAGKRVFHNLFLNFPD